MDNKQRPKDYAEKDWIKFKLELEDEPDWRYTNKESYLQIAKYFVFMAVAAACGYIFMLGVMS